ncbi:MAG: low temperature requirement protein A [Bacteroidetes bacterium]|nr:low temperature requirement protein A [Bacteroidota bacterium]
MRRFETPADTEASPVTRVSTLEIFFDLIFVFTVTQLTSLIAHPHGVGTFIEAALIFMVTWWMYDGYVWLTSNLRIERTRYRLLMLTGMIGFFQMALSVPTAFTTGTKGFGAGLMMAALAHAMLFAHRPRSSGRAITYTAPLNIAISLFVFASGFAPETWRVPLWAVAAGVLMVRLVSFIVFPGQREVEFSLSPTHFIERHGLILMIALGESIIAVGTSASGEGQMLSWEARFLASFALMLTASLWWTYFSRDDTRAEHVLMELPHNLRVSKGGVVALTHLGMIAGIVTLAAGFKNALGSTDERLLAASFLASGVSLYLLSDGFYRRSLGLGPGRLRFLFAALTFSTAPLGAYAGPLVQTVVLEVLLVWMLSFITHRRPDA